MHPAPPQDLRGLVQAFSQTAQAVLDLGHGCRDADFERETQCPGWTVKDQLSHITGIESRLEGVREPEVAVPDYAHVKGEVGRRIEESVQLRRGRPGPDIVAELDHVLAGRFATLNSPGLSEESIIPGPFGPAEAAEVLRLRSIDVWVHEQDIRQALARPGNLDSPAATVFLRSLFDALPMLVARRAGLELGTIVIIDVSGPILARTGVRVEAGADGRPWGHKLFTGERVEDDVPGEDGPTTSLSLSTDALTRRAAGRASAADTAYQVTGDEEVARRVLDAIVVTF
jgi:uncharacterized protein (TIGR03083 family)